MELFTGSGVYQWISIFTAIIAGILFIRRNDIKGLRDANEDLRSSIKDKQFQITDLQTQIDKLKGIVDKLEALLKEKDKRIDALEHIQVVQQLSPEFISFMSQVQQFMIANAKTTTHIQTMLTERTPIIQSINEEVAKLASKKVSNG